MLRSILVPLDGTEFAEGALRIASRLAKNSGCPLHLALSHTQIPLLGDIGGSAIVAPQLDQYARDEERSYLRRAGEAVGLDDSRQVELHELEGPAGPAICEEATRIGVDMIVMATHARGQAGRLWHGSVADHVVRHARVPVLLVRPEPPMSKLARARLATGDLRGILVALDLSPNSETILEPVERLALLTNAPVTLLHVIVEPRQTNPESDFESLLAARLAAGKRLEVLADGMRAAGVHVSTRVTPGLRPAWSVRDATLESQFDLLALATRGAGGLRRLLRGSTAEQLLGEVTKPMLIVCPPLKRGRSAAPRQKRVQSG